jgi:hypothetical protein
MISKILKDLYVTLNLADLPNLEPDEARQFLPTLRLFFATCWPPTVLKWGRRKQQWS